MKKIVNKKEIAAKVKAALDSGNYNVVNCGLFKKSKYTGLQEQTKKGALARGFFFCSFRSHML